MDVSTLSKNSCRLCLSGGDFNVSLFGNYARRTNIIEKIRVCLNVVIDDGDLTTICYKCAGNVERYYDFVTVIKKNQNRLKFKKNERHLGLLEESYAFNRRVSYVRDEVVDADYTFSFLENVEEKKEKCSSPLFSYMTPPKVISKNETDVWKTPRTFSQDKKLEREVKSKKKVPRKTNCSRDLFETQSQEEEPKGLDWKLTPDDNIIKRVRDKIFGWSK